MADIDQIIAGGAGASSRADFSGISGIADALFKARDEKAKNDLRTAFKDGVPTDANGQPDFGAMAKVLFQKGGLNEGTAAANLGLQQQNLQQARDDAGFIAGGQPQQPASTIVSPPSSNRGASVTVAPALNKGGVVPHSGQEPQSAPQGGSPQGDQPGSIVGLVSSAGIPDELAGPIIQQVSALTKTDPNATLNPQVAQRVQQVVQAAAQRMKGGQPQQSTGLAPQPAPQGQPVPQAVPAPVPEAQPQSPNPFANAQAQGLIPPGVDPARYVAGLKLRAAASPNPQTQKLATQQLEAINKSTEPTAEEKAFSASKRNPALDDYTAETEAAKESAKGVAQSDIKEQDGIIAAGQSARTRLATLNTISNIVSTDKNMTLGFGAETSLKVKKALETLGWNVGDLSGPQAIQKLNGLLASESAKAVSPRPAQFEFKTFLNNNPGLDLDKAGNMRVIGIFSQLAKRDVDLGKLARQNRDNWSNWDNVVEAYDKANPIKDPVTGRPITTNSIVAPGPAKGATTQAAATTVSSKADYDKLPSGATFTGPDGKPWRKP